MYTALESERWPTSLVIAIGKFLLPQISLSISAAEITPVSEVDGFSIGCGSRGPVTEKIQDAFFGLFNGKTEDKWGWLYPVK